MPPALATTASAPESDPVALARLLIEGQRDLFRRLADRDLDPAPLLTRSFLLVDRSDTLDLQRRGTLAPVARQDDYLRILAGRLPPEELQSDRFELHRQESGSVVIVSYLAGDRANMTVWAFDGESWKAGAMILNPPATELEWLAENAKPLMAR